MSTKANFKEGKPADALEMWFENGQKKLEIHFKDGKKDGSAKLWSENGQLQGAL
jgi:antitoxin component YwqK of YwqJK toxin-antitoxin module